VHSPAHHRDVLQGFTCPADSGQVCGNTPNPAGSNLDYGYQGFDNFAMLALVVFQVSMIWQCSLRAEFVCRIKFGSRTRKGSLESDMPSVLM